MSPTDTSGAERARQLAERHRRMALIHEALGHLQEALDCRVLADLEEERARRLDRPRSTTGG